MHTQKDGELYSDREWYIQVMELEYKQGDMTLTAEMENGLYLASFCQRHTTYLKANTRVPILRL